MVMDKTCILGTNDITRRRILGFLIFFIFHFFDVIQKHSMLRLHF
jgi:hypothetical protein